MKHNANNMLAKAATPVFFFSHGTTMMLGEDTSPAHEWKAVGDEALRRGIKSIVMMGKKLIYIYISSYFRLIIEARCPLGNNE